MYVCVCVCIGTQSVCVVSSVLSRRVRLDLHSILCAGCFVDAALADGEGAHADVLLQHVAIAEQHVLPMQLLQRARCGAHVTYLSNSEPRLPCWLDRKSTRLNSSH